MLNKRLCKRCINEWGKNTNGDNPNRIHGWNIDGADDFNWNRGLIDCPLNHDGKSVVLEEGPPEKCPYVLEHILHGKKRNS